MEAVSPKLTSLASIKDVINSLINIGSTVNRTCGLHFHFDMQDFSNSPEDLNRIINNTQELEPLIYKEGDPFRDKGGVGYRFCRSVKTHYDPHFLSCPTKERLKLIETYLKLGRHDV